LCTSSTDDQEHRTGNRFERVVALLYNRSRATMEELAEIFKAEGYALEELLFSDCWGELYRARYVPHAREVLLRRFPAALASDEGAWELMVAEVRAWARLDHPGILRVLDWGIAGRVSGAPACARAGAGGESFLATEMPAGTRLDALLEGCGPGGSAPGGRATEDTVIISLLAAVEEARAWGMLHLGLSPACVWVSAGGHVQVGEFGLWYVTRDFPSCGARDDPFLAPEQRSGGRVGAATDVYTLAVLCAFIHGGAEAAEAASAGGVLPDGPGGMAGVLSRCLDERPLARYRSAGELAGALWPGLSPADEPGGAEEGFHDCPLCRIKRELERHTVAGTLREYRQAGAAPVRSPAVAYGWMVALALAVACAVVWWMALR